MLSLRRFHRNAAATPSCPCRPLTQEPACSNTINSFVIAQSAKEGGSGGEGGYGISRHPVGQKTCHSQGDQSDFRRFILHYKDLRTPQSPDADPVSVQMFLSSSCKLFVLKVIL
ncbi:hypothetical protein AMECASPLE_005845 [Ameca splendens]|uniref:Uncharacterized protein n=1 Tax=Ameca splendens TaxID=208324 RepID=A0ABV1A7N9_9TELE